MPTDDRTDEQKMLERPVKGYQLRELTSEVSDMKNEFIKRFDDLTRGIEGVATMAYVEAIRSKLEEDFNIKIEKMEKNIHLRYGPLYKGVWWALGIIGTGPLGLAVIRLWG